MLRRDFLVQLAAGAMASGNSSFAEVKPRRSVARPYSKLSRIAISTESLHNFFRATRRSDVDEPGSTLALLDVPDLIVTRYDVRHFEFCSTHFSSIEPAYLEEMKYTLVRTGSTVVNIPVDIEECGPDGTFSSPDREERKAALDAVKQWVDVAHTLGARSVRVGPGKADPGDLERTAAAYQALATYAQAKDVHVVVENHGDFGTTHPEEMVKVLKLVGPGRLGALPDFANFPDEPTREKGLKMLFPLAPYLCHAQGLRFNAEGAEIEYDFPRAVEIAKNAGFRGVYSVEFEGPGDPYIGIQKTLDELLSYL